MSILDGVIFFYFASDIISKILKAIAEPIIHEKILTGPVGDFSPVKSAMRLKLSTIIRNTKKATEILRILL